MAETPRCDDDVDGIIVEILSRLPVRSLLRFRTVCKSWCALISESYFVQKHLDHAKLNPLFLDFSRSDRISQIKTIDLQGNRHCCIYQHDSSPEPGHENDRRRIIGSCNGLMCVQDLSNAISEYGSDDDQSDGESVDGTYPNKSDEFFIWNLSTKIVNELPKQNYTKGRGKAFHGFGYDPTTEDYKLILGDNYWPRKIRITIFTFKTGSWRAWEDKEFPFRSIWGDSFLVNGALHWADYSDYKIISFDLAEETFQKLCHLELKRTSQWFRMRIATVRESLCYYSYDAGEASMPMTIWVMKEYGVDKPWTKLMQVPINTIPCNKILGIRLLCITENGEVLVTSWGYHRDKKLFIYNTQEDKFKRVLESVNLWWGAGVLYSETLVKPEFGSGIQDLS